MKKKLIFLLFIPLFLAGCMKITDNYDLIIAEVLNNPRPKTNKTFQGYSFYLPKDIQIVNHHNNNLELKQSNNKLYLYVDLISYYNKVQKEYLNKAEAYYSIPLKKDNQFGYIEINLWQDNKYLVEIMYNYAKIEVIVENKDIKNIVSYALTILNSISFNDTIIESMIGKDVLNYNELEFNIFETAQTNPGSIQYDENSSSNMDQNKIPDLDLIN